VMFGVEAVLKHPFMAFPLEGGGTLHLPCGSVSTALVENEEGNCTIIMGLPSTHFGWNVSSSAEQVQEILREGMARLQGGDPPDPSAPQKPQLLPFPDKT